MDRRVDPNKARRKQARRNLRVAMVRLQRDRAAYIAVDNLAVRIEAIVKPAPEFEGMPPDERLTKVLEITHQTRRLMGEDVRKSEDVVIQAASATIS